MKKKNKKFDSTPKFSINDVIKHPKHGIGVVKKIDNEPNYDFFYYTVFTNRKGDGTKVWLPKVVTEKSCEVVGHLS